MPVRTLQANGQNLTANGRTLTLNTGLVLQSWDYVPPPSNGYVQPGYVSPGYVSPPAA